MKKKLREGLGIIHALIAVSLDEFLVQTVNASRIDSLMDMSQLSLRTVKHCKKL